MLIIAVPKSISTSVMAGLGNLMGVKYEQCIGLREEYGTYPAWNRLPHSDMAKIPKDMLEYMLKSPDVFKQHLIPIQEHQNILSSVGGKVIVLYRSPEGVYDAYSRSHKNKPVISPENKEEVLKQLESFCSGVKNIFQSDNKVQYLHVSYEEIIESNYNAVKKMLDFWGSNVSILKTYQLPKERYTRGK